MKDRTRKQKAARRARWKDNHHVKGMHEQTGLWLARVRSDEHVTLRAYGVPSEIGVFAAIALTRDGVEKLQRRLTNILAVWPEP